MVENFKLTAIELKRQLKISVYLPKNYNATEKQYPILYALDGQMMFHSLNDENKTFDLPVILDDVEKDCICVGIHAPKVEEWRISELCPYYKKDDSDVDPSLAKNLANYIENTLHFIIKQRYRINDNVYLLGFNEGAIFNLYALNHYTLFKGAGIFSPRLNLCEGIFEDIEQHFDSSKSVYLYFGGHDEDTNSFYNLYSKLEDMKCNKLKLIYEDEEDNIWESWQHHLKDFFQFILP